MARVAFAVHGIFVIVVVPSTLLLFFGFYQTLQLLWYGHWTAVLTMVAGAARYGRCLLVEIEQRLRAAAGQAMPYEGSFTVYFLRSLTRQEVPGGFVTAVSRLVVLLTIGSLIMPRG